MVVVVGEVVGVVVTVVKASVGMLRVEAGEDKALSDFGGVVRVAGLVTWAVIGLVGVVIIVAIIGGFEIVVRSIRVASWVLGIEVVFRVVEVVEVVVN